MERWTCPKCDRVFLHADGNEVFVVRLWIAAGASGGGTAKTMKKISLVALLLVATQTVDFSQERTNQVSTVQGVLGAFLQVTNVSSPTFGIFTAADDVAHVYARNRAPAFVGNAIGGTGIDLTAIPVLSNWDSPPPTGGNPYGGARFNGILVTPDILLQAHHRGRVRGMRRRPCILWTTKIKRLR